MNNKIQIAVIGAGMWGQIHIRHFHQTGRASVRWVCSAAQSSVDEAQREFSIPYGSTDYRQALADPQVQAVVIATPPYLHASMAIDAMQSGKHILLEKPVVATRTQMNSLLSEAAKHPEWIILEASCRHTRLQPKFKFVKTMIQSGYLGQIYHIHHNHLLPTTFIEYNPRGAWALNRKLAGGGPFFDMGEYDLSFHLGLLDDLPSLRSLRAFTRNDLRDMTGLVPTADVEQHGAAWMEFDTGLTYYYERGAGMHLEAANETRLAGTKGGLRLSYYTWDSSQMDFYALDGAGKPSHKTLSVDMSGHPEDNLALVEHFLDCLQGKAQPVMPLSLAAKHIDILFRITQKQHRSKLHGTD